MTESGLQTIFLAHRAQLLRFLAAHGAIDAAEDILHEIWLKIETAPPGPVSQPLSYLYRVANNLIIDRYRARQQSERRDAAWLEGASTIAGQSDVPSAERQLIARDQLAVAQRLLESLGPRAATIFRRHRMDGVAQRDIAREMGVSLSTVESDLRLAYRAMIDLRRRFDEA